MIVVYVVDLKQERELEHELEQVMTKEWRFFVDLWEPEVIGKGRDEANGARKNAERR